jgi:GT2 family glycosyltransferase
MASAVVNVDTTDGFDDIAGLDPYTSAYLVIRHHGVPVGHAWVPVTDGRVTEASVRATAEKALPALALRWAERHLLHTPASPASLPSASIAICTRERPDDLARTLRAVVAEASRGGHPVVVVDNRPSTTRTRDVVTSFPGVRYVREDRPGLNAARNRALRECGTHIVAFTDDDATPETGWLDALRAAFGHPLRMGVTGLALPLELETPAQEWFERISPFGRGYIPHTFDPMHCSPNSAGHVGAGANMALRRDVLEHVGGFDETLDAGTPTRSGGDHEFFARVLAAGYHLHYEPRAVSLHRHRRTWEELRDTLHGYGVGVYAAWTGHLVSGNVCVLKQAALWLVRVQAPALARALARRPGAIPLDLVLAELAGCLRGPLAWAASQRLARRAQAEQPA